MAISVIIVWFGARAARSNCSTVVMAAAIYGEKRDYRTRAWGVDCLLSGDKSSPAGGRIRALPFIRKRRRRCRNGRVFPDMGSVGALGAPRKNQETT
jgi:hypothetical protein